MEKNIKVFIGVIGSGKDYRCQKLVETGEYEKIAFADDLRQLTWELLEWEPKNSIDYDDFKLGRINGYLLGTEPFSSNPDYWVTGRKFLQNIGTSLRNRDEDFWVNVWKNKVAKSNKNICCSDCRFPNEVLSILSLSDMYNVEFIFTNYKSERYSPDDDHISERYAQILLSYGYNDGDIIKKFDLTMAMSEFENLK